jgi:hypothetical protein
MGVMSSYKSHFSRLGTAVLWLSFRLMKIALLTVQARPRLEPFANPSSVRTPDSKGIG